MYICTYTSATHDAPVIPYWSAVFIRDASFLLLTFSYTAYFSPSLLLFLEGGEEYLLPRQARFAYARRKEKKKGERERARDRGWGQKSVKDTRR